MGNLAPRQLQNDSQTQFLQIPSATSWSTTVAQDNTQSSGKTGTVDQGFPAKATAQFSAENRDLTRHFIFHNNSTMGLYVTQRSKVV